jgi:homoserine kinase type II
MAVYTHVAAEDLAEIVQRFGAGTLQSAKGIAEGVENSNYLIDTDQGRFIFTVYEKRVDPADLPFFFAMIDHLVAKGCPVPRALADADGRHIVEFDGKATAMMEFMPGLSVSHPTPDQAAAVGAALGHMHGALLDFPLTRANAMGPEGWYSLAERCAPHLDQIEPGLQDRVMAECAYLQANWPADLPTSAIHADLFPDNVLLVGDTVGALIDFTFACTEVRAWDLAVAHAAWAFAADGSGYDAAVGDALIAGYDLCFGRSDAEKAAFAVLGRGACLRFLLTRAWDWVHTPADALVVRKDPLAFRRRLDFYAGQS